VCTCPWATKQEGKKRNLVNTANIRVWLGGKQHNKSTENSSAKSKQDEPTKVRKGKNSAGKKERNDERKQASKRKSEKERTNKRIKRKMKERKKGTKRQQCSELVALRQVS